jgi:hypothetical protein
VRSGTSGTSSAKNAPRELRRAGGQRKAQSLGVSSTRPAHGSCPRLCPGAQCSCASPWIDQEELPELFLLDCALPYSNIKFRAYICRRHLDAGHCTHEHPRRHTRRDSHSVQDCHFQCLLSLLCRDGCAGSKQLVRFSICAQRQDSANLLSGA